MLRTIEKFAFGIFEKINYTITHMSLPQWGIVTAVALMIGMVLLKPKR